MGDTRFNVGDQTRADSWTSPVPIHTERRHRTHPQQFPASDVFLYALQGFGCLRDTGVVSATPRSSANVDCSRAGFRMGSIAFAFALGRPPVMLADVRFQDSIQSLPRHMAEHLSPPVESRLTETVSSDQLTFCIHCGAMSTW